ncbi:NUDIX hydrolase [Pelagicoccus albus]|uniref:NUDIX domain-containing protein n=1 Tax=Pelagicoccus albus TaxID=415222 RepID=A0A7X1B919_9BACT|nr:NUDIX domain-containing protein [Pelagicoccus albus]MBC2607930.1 NUDIX domain-containing protein [Pelagicoccus albus]
MKVIDKIAWIHLADRKILGARSKGKDVWYLPGGKREAGETDTETLVREVKEELAVEILADQAALIGVYEAQADGHAEGLIVKMTCYSAPFKGTLKPSSEIEEITWLDSRDSDKISEASRLIFSDLKQRGLLD